MDSIIDKIRRLRALSQSTNVHEAAAAAAAANKLIDAHRINEADLAVVSSATLIEEDEDPVYEAGRIKNWKVRLVRVLCNNYGCEALINKGYRIKAYTVVGRKSDIEIVRYMFIWLSTEVQRLCVENMRGEGHVACFSYCEGAVTGIANQLYRSRQESNVTAKANGQAAAMVKLDSLQMEVTKFIDAMKLRTINTGTKGFIDPVAFDQGKNRGEAIHLGKSLDTSGNPVKQLNSK